MRLSTSSLSREIAAADALPSTPPEAANQATFPYISDIVNSSPSPNTYGERVVTSLFSELQIPLATNLDSQLAVRAENSDDYGSNVVGKFALFF